MTPVHCCARSDIWHVGIRKKLDRRFPNRVSRRSLIGVQFQRATPIVGARRPRVIQHLVIASITMILALQSSAARASAEPSKTGTCTAVNTILTEASSELLMPSESDYPFTSFTWINAAKPGFTIARLLEITGHAPDIAVEVVDLDYFFRGVAHHQPWHDRQQAMSVRKFKRLTKVLEQHLIDIRVYRIGTIRIDAYIVGRCGSDLAGLSTTLIET